MSHREVTAENIKNVVAFLPRVEKLGAADIARWVQPESTEPGVLVMGSHVYHPLVTELMRAFYENGFVQPFDWGAWQDEARRYYDDPELVNSADLDTCVKLITLHVRKERFCEGHLAAVLESGHMTAILRRLQGHVSDEAHPGPDAKNAGA